MKSSRRKSLKSNIFFSMFEVSPLFLSSLPTLLLMLLRFFSLDPSLNTFKNIWDSYLLGAGELSIYPAEYLLSEESSLLRLFKMVWKWTILNLLSSTTGIDSTTTIGADIGSRVTVRSWPRESFRDADGGVRIGDLSTTQVIVREGRFLIPRAKSSSFHLFFLLKVSVIIKIIQIFINLRS